MKHKIAVIGAGPSGITALKNLLDQGLDVVAFDRNADVGGNWIYSENESHSSVFETTHIISSKTLSQYEDFTFDDFDPDAVTKLEFISPGQPLNTPVVCHLLPSLPLPSSNSYATVQVMP